MKKLKLSLQDIEGAQVLTREQLKMIIGGGSGTCAFTYDAKNMTGSITVEGASSQVIEGTKVTVYGVDKDTASGAMGSAGSGGHWCCDNCGSATWYNPPPAP